ncbi:MULTISPECIES: ankyrin repeat domain-containing protein [unclassified Ornithinimicrobium]|uniref:ankyrin repeat domain-containing protein n=1 Tax=unclassified Ornithinimicrobium TaxID=2615080 RepID=UPI0038519587
MSAHPAPPPEPPAQETVDLAHALFDLARAGRAEQLAAYVDAGAPVDLADPAGNTLLMLAAYHGHPDLVRELARRGADVDRLNDRGQSPLAGAVFKGEDEVVATLLDEGADPDAGVPSARQTAQMFGRSDLVPADPGPAGEPS